MSQATQPSEEQYYQAIDYLFGFQTLATNYNIVITEEDKRKYAQIGAFFSDVPAVCIAMQNVSAWMLDKFKTFPQEFAYTSDAPFVRRMAGQKNAIDSSMPDLEGKKSKERSSIANAFGKSKSVMQEAFANKQEKLRALAREETIDGGLEETDGVVVRRFRFRKLLAALESQKLGLKDSGTVYTDDVKIAPVLRAGEVWKDSIGFDHGEYTHRLQWLAIKCHFDWDQTTCLRLYKGTSATLKRSVYQAFGYGSIDQVPDADAQMALPVNVWAFLFDGREPRGNATQCWPTAPVSVQSGKEHEAYRFAGRTPSCRSPAFLNRILKAGAEFGLIHAYLAASSIKLLEPALGRADRNKPERSISEYRKDRLRAKTLRMFETPFSPDNNQLS